MRVAQLGELALIERLKRLFCAREPAAAESVISGRLRVGIGDDAAVVESQGALALCVDSIEAGCDWLPDRTPPEAIGHRAAAVNLSDLAAMGAAPQWLLVALRLDPNDEVSAIERAAAGMQALAVAHGTRVIGGDLDIGVGPQRWTVTAAGSLVGSPMCRDAARPGDLIWLIGEVGRAAIGLQWLTREPSDASERRSWPPSVDDPAYAHLAPQPLVAAGCALAASGARVATIDVSDGLWLDAERLARASAVDLELDVSRPRWLGGALTTWCARRQIDWRAACAAGGDDYALLVAAEASLDVAAVVAATGCVTAVQAIGHARTGGGDVRLRIAGEVPQVAQRGHLYGLS